MEGKIIYNWMRGKVWIATEEGEILRVATIEELLYSILEKIKSLKENGTN